MKYESRSSSCAMMTTIFCMFIVKRSKVLKTEILSDPQRGKGACDRKAATVKAHVRRYINEGHDVETAEDFKSAILSHGGLSGVRAALVDNPQCKHSV